MKFHHLILGIISIALVSCSGRKPASDKNQTIIRTDSLRIDSLTRLIEKKPDKAELLASRSVLYAAKGSINNAVKDLILANRIDSLNPDYYLKLADLYLSMGKSETVNSVLQRGNRLIPGNKDILYFLGKLYFYIKDYKKSLVYLDQAIRVDNFYAKPYFTKGMVFLETDQPDKAVRNFQIAVERDPEFYDAYIQLGLVFAGKSDSLAIAYYNNALRLNPGSYEADYGKAMFYQENGKPEKAMGIYREMLKKGNNRLPEIYFNMGYVNMNIYGEYLDAIQNFDSAVSLNPKYVDALCNRAYCYEKINNNSKARLDYLLALEIKPNYELAVAGIDRLNKK